MKYVGVFVNTKKFQINMVGSKVNQQLVSSLSLISAVLNNFIAAKIVFRSHVKIGLHNEATA